MNKVSEYLHTHLYRWVCRYDQETILFLADGEVYKVLPTYKEEDICELLTNVVLANPEKYHSIIQEANSMGLCV